MYKRKIVARLSASILESFDVFHKSRLCFEDLNDTRMEGKIFFLQNVNDVSLFFLVTSDFVVQKHLNQVLKRRQFYILRIVKGLFWVLAESNTSRVR